MKFKASSERLLRLQVMREFIFQKTDLNTSITTFSPDVSEQDLIKQGSLSVWCVGVIVHQHKN